MEPIIPPLNIQDARELMPSSGIGAWRESPRGGG